MANGNIRPAPEEGALVKTIIDEGAVTGAADTGALERAAAYEREIDRALAWYDLYDAVEVGHIDTAKMLAKEYDLPLEHVWAPEDDGAEPEGKDEEGT